MESGKILLVCLAFAAMHLGFTLNDIRSDKLPSLEEKQLTGIKEFQLGTREGFSFKGMGFKLGDAIDRLKGVGRQFEVQVLGRNAGKVVLQQRRGNEEINYFLVCKRGKCSLESGLLLMKPTGEVLPLPKKNAKMGLMKSLN